MSNIHSRCELPGKHLIFFFFFLHLWATPRTCFSIHLVSRCFVLSGVSKGEKHLSSVEVKELGLRRAPARLPRAFPFRLKHPTAAAQTPVAPGSGCAWWRGADRNMERGLPMLGAGGGASVRAASGPKALGRGREREGAQAARAAAPGFPQGMTPRRRAAIGCAAASSPFMDTSPARLARGSRCCCRRRSRQPQRSRGRPARSGPLRRGCLPPPRPGGGLRARGGRARSLPPLPPSVRPSRGAGVSGQSRGQRSAEEPRW